MRLRNAAIPAAVIIAFGIDAGALASSQCVACAPGTYSGGGTATTCTTCPPNHYCPGSADKVPCPSGKSTNGGTGKTAEADCKQMCGVGQKYNGTICEPCPSGQYQDSTAHQSQTCKTCPTGSVSKGTTGSGSSASAVCSCNAGLVWQTNQNLGCCALNNGTCLNGNVEDNSPSGVTIEGGCFGYDTQQSRGSSAPGGGYCHCRGKTANGAVSEWSYDALSVVNGGICRDECSRNCPKHIKAWGPNARW